MSCGRPRMIGPAVCGSERGLKADMDPKVLFAMCLHPDFQSDLSPASSRCFPVLLYSLHVSVSTVHPDAAAGQRMTSRCPGAGNSITSSQKQQKISSRKSGLFFFLDLSDIMFNFPV